MTYHHDQEVRTILRSLQEICSSQKRDLEAIWPFGGLGSSIPQPLVESWAEGLSSCPHKRPQSLQKRIWAESDCICQEYPITTSVETQKGECRLAGYQHTWVPMSVAVLENTPPMLATARQMTTACI